MHEKTVKLTFFFWQRSCPQNTNMLTRRKVYENADPVSQIMGPKKRVIESSIKGTQDKLKKPVQGQTKRAAFGDITNTAIEKALQGDSKKVVELIKTKFKNQFKCDSYQSQQACCEENYKGEEKSQFSD